MLRESGVNNHQHTGPCCAGPDWMTASDSSSSDGAEEETATKIEKAKI